jgi:hypothetical protein
MSFCRRVTTFPALLLIRFYRRFVSRFLPPSCRFTPTCSAYAEEAFRTFGLVRGAWLTLRRLLRCQPLCRGGHDPVPRRGETARVSRD